MQLLPPQQPKDTSQCKKIRTTVDLIEQFYLQAFFRIETRCFAAKFDVLASTLVFKLGAKEQTSPGL
jgi:hypothetical protein